MPKFLVTMYEATAVTYVVEADTKDEAEEIVEYGDSNLSTEVKRNGIERECIESEMMQ